MGVRFDTRAPLIPDYHTYVYTQAYTPTHAQHWNLSNPRPFWYELRQARTHRTRHSYKLSAPFAADFTYVSVTKRCSSKATATNRVSIEPEFTICAYNSDGESFQRSLVLEPVWSFDSDSEDFFNFKCISKCSIQTWLIGLSKVVLKFFSNSLKQVFLYF